jgi:hypothetical protein
VSGEADQEAPQRGPIEAQLRVGLVIVQALGGLMVLLAVVTGFVAFQDDDTEDPMQALLVAFAFVLLPAVVLFFTARSARARLFVHAPSAKLFSVLTGVFTVLAGIPLLGNLTGVLLLVVGLFVLTAALLYRWKEPA